VKRYVILAEGAFDEEAKTATGVMRYARSPTVAVIDSTRAGTAAGDHVPGMTSDVPVVATLADTLRFEPTTLLVGVAPAGGKLPDAYRRAILEALENGLDVESGLHDFLGDDPDFDSAARLADREIHDLRRAPHGLNVPTGANLAVPTHTVLTVGSDCALGKMTVCLELDAEARRRGLASVFVPTGQTGIAIAGWGIAVDHVISDYVAGAAERLVDWGSERGDLLFVEGQGALFHPAYSGVTLGLLHGSAPDALVLAHQAGATAIRNYPEVPLLPLPELVAAYEAAIRPLRPARVAAVALNTSGLDGRAARAAVAEVEEQCGVAADDVVRFGPERVLDAVLTSLEGR
jgi:uncharacterized NAD-dependent epimerase/dehydratase family protein